MPLSPTYNVSIYPIDEEEAFESPEEIAATPIQQQTTVRKRKKDSIQKSAPLCPPQAELEEESENDRHPCADPPSSPSPSADVSHASEEKSDQKTSVKRRRRESNAENGDSKTRGADKKTKNQAILEQFMMDTLPALRRNMKQAKAAQASFKITEHSQYFGKTSPFVATFILPLFHFLGKEEIVCSQVRDFNGKKYVKTTAGFNHATLIVNHALDLTDEEKEYVMKKFGNDFFKIPSKDWVKAVSASKYGDKGEFKVTLTGLYEDSFRDDEGKEVMTINPILRYDSIHAKPSTDKKDKKKEKKEKPSKE